MANFLNSGSSNNNESNFNQDEHAIIANYSTLLSEFYHKNPHLASSPNSCSPSSLTNQPQVKLKSNLKTKCGYDSQYRSSQYESSLNRPLPTQRTGSLQRQSCQSSMSNRINANKMYSNAAYYNNTYSNGSGAAIPSRTTTNNAKLSPMLMQNTTRSLSESNFRTSNEAEFEYDEESGGDIQEDRLLKEKRDIVAKLEKQNKEIINEINRLRLQQLSNKSLERIEQQEQQQMARLKSRENTPVLTSTLTRQRTQQANNLGSLSAASQAQLNSILATFSASSTMINPQLMAELQTLKHRKGLLENRMQMLENSRDELIGRLTQLDTSFIKYNSSESPAAARKNRIITSTNSLRNTPINSPRTVNTQHKYATLVQQQPSVVANSG